MSLFKLSLIVISRFSQPGYEISRTLQARDDKISVTEAKGKNAVVICTRLCP